MRLLAKLGLTTALLVSLCAPAQAYVDPNSGGILFQLLTPLIALAAAAWAFARRRLLNLWIGLRESLKALVARLFRA